MRDEQLADLFKTFGHKLATKMLKDRETAYHVAAKQARLIEQQLSTISPSHQPAVWREFATKNWASALGLVASYKAQSQSAVDTAFEQARIAFDGDDRMWDNALRSLIALRTPAGSGIARVDDQTAKAIKDDMFWDGISQAAPHAHER